MLNFLGSIQFKDPGHFRTKTASGGWENFHFVLIVLTVQSFGSTQDDDAVNHEGCRSGSCIDSRTLSGSLIARRCQRFRRLSLRMKCSTIC